MGDRRYGGRRTALRAASVYGCSWRRRRDSRTTFTQSRITPASAPSASTAIGVRIAISPSVNFVIHAPTSQTVTATSAATTYARLCIARSLAALARRVPDLEAPARARKGAAAPRLERGDLLTQAEEHVVEPPLRVARVGRGQCPLERRAALGTRHVAGVEEV